ncbi:MAG: Ig-like domain-containing protein [Clostridiaceae bacterium]|nr:Ig-like domain-containing protein [Clostridiaceae bacterium]
MKNKKTLSLILAFVMMFSTVPTVFAEAAAAIGSDAKTISAIGVLSGDSAEGVTEEYLAKETTRLQAAIMYLRLQGKEEKALAYTGTANFKDAGTITWAGGRAVMAYLKANPQLGWIGSNGYFNPSDKITVKQYYKVMLEALGYKQTTAEEDGDFEWKDVTSFAKSKGLDNLSENISFKNNDLAIATVEALKAKVKGTDKTLAVKLVDSGLIDKAAATKAGLYGGTASGTAEATVDKVVAIGNTAVEVIFDDDIDKSAANAGSYSIKGLSVSSAIVTGTDTVWLETSAQKAGTLYNLTFGKKSVSFTGIGKLSEGPSIEDVKSEDVEEVLVTFDKNVDYSTATNISNYTISGIDITKAEISKSNEVVLTTEGLKDNTSYKVKAEGIKSIDGVSKRSSTDTFKTRFDDSAPRIDTTNTKVETNRRIILYFNEKVTEESAEDLDNYVLKVNKTDGDELAINSVTWDRDDENNVEIITEDMKRGESYRLTVDNISDQRKSPNIMSRADTWSFKGIRADDDAPEFSLVTVISKNKLIVEFTDDSKIDEDSVTDTNNYIFTKNDESLDVDDVKILDNETGTLRALVTVEDMEAGKKYQLEVTDIADEFGNSIDEASKPVNPKAADFVSAALVDVKVNSKSSITLSFSKKLNEDSAENIGNYSLDGGIGTPISATLNDEGIKVELKVNELTNGETYDLTVDGVMDIAGNVLKFTKKGISAISGSKWDTEAPELEEAYAENMYVAALRFNEKVKFTADAELWLAGGGYTKASPLKLKAKTLAEDDTVVEFSLLAGSKWAKLDEDEEYTVINGTGITDLAGNKFVMTDEDFSFDGSDDTPDYAEVESIDQADGSSFEVEMTRNVIFKNSGHRTAGKATINGFVITIDDNIVTFQGAIEDGKEYIFDLSDFLTDEHGMAVINDEVDDNPKVNRTVLVGEETDDEEPYIENVEAINNVAVEIEFSERIAAADKSNFEIRNENTGKKLSIDTLKIDKKTVTLVLSTPLEGRYEYELSMDGNKVADFAGNKADEDSLYFNGSDLAPVK